MVHYHGAPISGSSIDADEFYDRRHAMVSFAHPEQLPVIAAVCQTFALDNGAFSAWKKTGGRIDVSAYVSWVGLWGRHPSFDFAIAPDVIDGNEDENDDMLFDFCKAAPLDRADVVPVWHLHESLDRLARFVGCFRRIALGSSGSYRTPGSSSWWARMNEAMAVLCDSQGRPLVRIHGLRMLNPAIFTRVPFHSADSTNAVQNAGSTGRFGSYPPPDAATRANTIARRTEMHQSPAVWVPAEATTEALYA